MKFAGAQAAKFCKKPDPATWAFLLFGDDDGVIGDAASALRHALCQHPQDAELITLDQDDIRREPAILFDALEARSLLGGDRIIRVRTTGDKIAALLLEAIGLGEDAPGRFDARLIISAGSLQKRSKLRTVIEGAKHACALHFFADDAGDLAGLARAKLASRKVDIEDAALDMLVADLPGHRGMANQEIEKLALFGHGLGRPIATADIKALSTTDAEHALHDLVRDTLAGKTALAHAGLDRLMIAGTSPISILRALQRDVTRLLQAHALAGAGGDIGMKLRPPVFKNAWPVFRAQMSLWSPKRLARILERIYDAEATIKNAGPAGTPIVRRLIGELSAVAERAA